MKRIICTIIVVLFSVYVYSQVFNTNVLLAIDGKICLEPLDVRIEVVDNPEKINIKCLYSASRINVTDSSSIEILKNIPDTALLLVTIKYFKRFKYRSWLGIDMEYQFYINKRDLYSGYMVIGIVNGRRREYELAINLGWKAYVNWYSKKMKTNRKIFTSY